jgi:hypothetical protein
MARQEARHGAGGSRAQRRARRRRHLLLPPVVSLLVPLLLALAPRDAHAKGLNVTLKARWEGTSFLLEAAEFLVSR